MDEKTFEKYSFLKIYTIDFDSASHLFKVLKRYKRKDVRYSLLRDIVVTYARPFSQNKGTLLRNHSLPLRLVPKNCRPLHNLLIKVRNQLFAHTDLSYRSPQIVNWSKKGEPRFPMAFRGFNYDQLDSRVDEINSLVQQVDFKLKEETYKIEKALCAEPNDSTATDKKTDELAPVSAPLFFTGPSYDWEK